MRPFRKIHLKIPEKSNLKLHQLEKVIRKLKNEQEIYPSTQSRSYSQVESIHLAKVSTNQKTVWNMQTRIQISSDRNCDDDTFIISYEHHNDRPKTQW